MASVRSKVRQRTGQNTTGQDLSSVVGAISSWLRAWGNYFRWGNSTNKFGQVDIYVRQRLAIWMSKKHQLARSPNWERFDCAKLPPALPTEGSPITQMEGSQFAQVPSGWR
jgi:hypothetical protein